LIFGEEEEKKKKKPSSFLQKTYVVLVQFSSQVFQVSCICKYALQLSFIKSNFIQSYIALPFVQSYISISNTIWVVFISTQFFAIFATMVVK
jgi:hypothetical protein